LIDIKAAELEHRIIDFAAFFRRARLVRRETPHRPTAMANEADIEESLFNMPPTSRQRRSALLVAAVLIGGVAAIVPFVDRPLPPHGEFITIIIVAVFITDFITAIMLFSQLAIHRSPALLALASGYLFTALIVIPYALGFPGALSPTGLFGATAQSSPWLFRFWHLGLPIAVLIYAWFKDKDHEKQPHDLPLYSVGFSVAVVVAVVVALAWIAIAESSYLPTVFADNRNYVPLTNYLAAFNVLISAFSLAVLWVRRRSVLDLWIMVALLALTLEVLLAGVLSSARFSLGFYYGRTLSIVTSTIVLTVLLGEMSQLYAALARSNVRLRREQDNRLMSLDALASSISHEVRQPLTGIVASGSALLRFLGDTPPKLDRARSSAEGMIAATHRASQMLDDIRNLFGSAKHPKSPIDVNDLTIKSLNTLDGELKKHNVITRIQLASQLPPIMGYGGQLQEVIVNLIQNAIDAMDSIDKAHRVLQVRTKYNGADAVSVEIEDSGPGVDAKKSDTIFEAFFTTKPHGMGLGLAICRMIVERHEGWLDVSSAVPHGAIFRIMLPITK
jgi:signal transduction histidine kinase